LTGVSAYHAHRLRVLHLPIPALTSILSLFLPILQAVFSLRLSISSSAFATTALDAAYSLSTLDVLLIGLATFQASPEILSCTLDTQWAAWFQTKHDRPIRDIQNMLECCGLHSTRDRAFPFPDRTHTANACVEAYSRDAACGTQWMGRARGALMFFAGLGVVGLVLKVWFCCLS